MLKVGADLCLANQGDTIFGLIPLPSHPLEIRDIGARYPDASMCAATAFRAPS
jgi:hypothetical protein